MRTKNDESPTLRFMSHLVELLFDYKIKGLLKHCVDVMFLITVFKREVSVEPL